MMTWINVAILVLFIVINAIIAYRFGKAVGIAMFLYIMQYTMTYDAVKEWTNELDTLGEKVRGNSMTQVEKLKFQLILKFCIKEFVL